MTPQKAYECVLAGPWRSIVLPPSLGNSLRKAWCIRPQRSTSGPAGSSLFDVEN